MTITFRTKIRGGVVNVPAIQRHHCDMHAFRTSRTFGHYANSDLFLGLLRRVLAARGVREWFAADQPPAGVTVDATGFLAAVTIDVPDERCW